MKVSIDYAQAFLREAKALKKKYASLEADLQRLIEELKVNPRMGTPLGFDTYKIRLAIGSKNKGKSGGARVISFVEALVTIEAEEEEITVALLSIFDKSEQDTITKKELLERIRRLKD